MCCQDRASSPIFFHSLALSWSFSAAMFSSRCASDDIPGIGNMTGDFCNNQARAKLHDADVVTFRFGFQNAPQLYGLLFICSAELKCAGTQSLHRQIGRERR
jgi:hypothetical protein